MLKASRSIALFAGLLFLNCFAPVLRAADVTPPGGVDVPDWALGALSFRQLGSSLEKTGAYANNLLPNSAELAKQIIMGGLFKLPINSGIKNGTAMIFVLDPIATGVKEELAFILPVGDAAVIKKAFIDTYGAPAEKDGVMTFTLPQPLPQPDKILLAKLVQDRLLLGPNDIVIKKLENYVDGKTDAMLSGAGTSDATLAIKIANIKRAFGQTAEMGLALLAQLAGPGRADETGAATELLQKIWQLDVVEVRLELNAAGTNGTLEFLAGPQKGTPLAQQLAESGKPVTENALRTMPATSALFATWNINGLEMMKTFKPTVRPGNDDTSKAMSELELALVDFIQLVDGQSGVSVALAPDNSPLTLIAVQSSNGKLFHEGVKGLWEKWQKVVKEVARAEAQTPGTHLQWKFKDSKDTYAGVTIHSFQAALENLDPEAQMVLQSAAGWPPTIRHALVGEKAFFTIGKDGLDAIKQAIDREKNGPAPSAESLRALLASEPRFAGAITTTNLARLIFANVPLSPKISLDRLTRGLTDTPIAISGKADKFLYLRAEVPIAAADAVGTIFQRLENVSFKFDPPALKGGDAPAPPPP